MFSICGGRGRAGEASARPRARGTNPCVTGWDKGWKDTGTYDFYKVATAMGTNETVFVSVPFLTAEMAVDQFPLARRVVCYRRHDWGCSRREQERGQGGEGGEGGERAGQAEGMGEGGGGGGEGEEDKRWWWW